MFNKEFKKTTNLLIEDIYDKLMELKQGELDDLQIMRDITDWTNKMERRVDLLESRFECWKEIHRENMMLLMEYLGVYLDVENDQKVVKKEKKPRK